MILFINTCLNIEKKIDILHNMTRDKLNVFFCTFVFHQFTKKKKNNYQSMFNTRRVLTSVYLLLLYLFIHIFVKDLKYPKLSNLGS